MKLAGKEIMGVIFDLDGTLLDSMPVWENVGNDFLLRRNIIPRENLAEIFKTMSLEESAVYYQTRYGISETTEEIIVGIGHLIEEAYQESIPLKDGVRELIAWLKERKIPMCIATATDEELVRAALRRTEIEDYFIKIVTCGQVGFSKEYPAVYDVAKNYLHTEKENTLVIEDATHAAMTAHMAGYPVLAVYDPSETEQKKLEEVADRYVCSLKEMERELV